MKAHAELALLRTKNLTPPDFNFGGHWRNELGSYMDLSIDSNNYLQGTYTSAVSGTDGPAPTADLRGTVTGDLISFSVNWGNSIAAWTGHGIFDGKGGQPQILTLWQLVVSVSDETNLRTQWETVFAGADTFSR
jgi:hypothetical protein